MLQINFNDALEEDEDEYYDNLDEYEDEDEELDEDDYYEMDDEEEDSYCD
ncbi:MAG: hypothetical protein PHH41_09365 [Sulfurimonas sp.]|nr:hypothetical protein [Sulfurimonas sp.]MDD3060095.1 hypothetical protein [Sulfurimonas sp.]MDD5203337.1 hypothetical protein [Sulfurimonas sp.]